MSPEQIRAQLRAARQSWVEVAPGKSVQILRPAEADLAQFLVADADGQRNLSVELAHVQRFVTDWRGITEADLLGGALASDTPAAFDAGLWADVVADRTDWRTAVAQALLSAIVAHLDARAATAKN